MLREIESYLRCSLWPDVYLFAGGVVDPVRNKVSAAQENLQHSGAQCHVVADAALLLMLRPQPCSSTILLKQGTL
jgi:hypothetical protein